MAISLADIEQQIGVFFAGSTKRERPAPAQPREDKNRPLDAMVIAQAEGAGYSATCKPVLVSE